MTTVATRPATTDARSDVTARFLAALAARDFTAIEQVLAPDVWLRALLVREIREARDATGTVAALREWFAEAEDLDVHALEQATVEGRQRLRWQFVLRPPWAPDVRHRIEQVGYAGVRDGRISRLDLACTGYHPLVDAT